MKFEDREKNSKPKESGNKNLPTMVLFILVGIICLLLYVGWQYLGDTPSNAEEMVPTQPDAVSQQMENETSMEVDEDSVDIDTISSVQPSPNLPSNEKPTAKIEEVPTKENTAPATKPKPEETAKNLGGSTYTHTVASGETFFSIASRYNLTTETLKSYNPSVNPESIKVGVTVLKIPINTIHVVGPGDILRVVASKYGLSVETLMKANGKDKNFAQRGERLVIPYSTKK